MDFIKTNIKGIPRQLKTKVTLYLIIETRSFFHIKNVFKLSFVETELITDISKMKINNNSMTMINCWWKMNCFVNEFVRKKISITCF